MGCGVIELLTKWEVGELAYLYGSLLVCSFMRKNRTC